VCWTANNTNATSEPTWIAACSNWTLANMSWTWPWTWSCNGENEGINATCETNAFCATRPNYEHAIFTEWTPTSVNQAWQNQDISSPCYYTCNTWYTWDWDSCEPEQSNPKANWTVEMANLYWVAPSTINVPAGCVVDDWNDFLYCYWANF
jgi:hypothetical protein